MFSDYILIRQLIVSLTLFVLGEIYFQKILHGVLIGDMGRE